MIGVLALQGAFAAHGRSLAALGHASREVRAPRDLDGLAGLVLPGGESTAQRELLGALGLLEPLARFVATCAPIFATCAGLVLAARFGWLDVDVARNAFGPQTESFEDVDDAGAVPLVLIRAPRITRVGAAVRVLATWRGEPVLVREGHVVGATFHPELTSSLDVHRLAFGDARPRAELPVNAA
ncbi:MAG TPA: pyridoxal 5'-phosphate synthase glutaminase subunit PdxT [Byssovorax sp.]